MTDTVTTPPPAKARRKPADRQPSKAAQARDAVLAEEELLATVPPMKDPTRLPFRSRNQILLLSTRLNGISDADGEIEIDETDAEKMRPFLDLIADFADIAKSLAHNPDEWDRWEETATYTQMGTLLAKYGRAVGESTGSSN